MGILSTIIGLLIIAWSIYGLSLLLGWRLSQIWFGSAILLFTCIFFVSGIYNAYNPEVKNINLKIKNLPSEWQGKKIIQVSDLHLGHILGRSYLESIIAMINKEKPQAIFITGDFFDGSGDGYEYISEVLNQIETPEGIFFITGNHETYFGLDKVDKFLTSPKIQKMDDNMIEVNGLQIIGINYPEQNEKKDIAEIIKNIADYDSNKSTILLYHEPVQINQIATTGVNLMLSGHTHRGQIWPFNYFTWLFYHGKNYGLHQIKDFNLYISSGSGTWGPTMRIGSKSEVVAITLE